LPVETLDKLFGAAGSGVMQRLGAKVVLADSEAEDYPASNVLDGDPQSIWHTPWTGDNPPEFPHYLVIQFPKPISLRGVKFLPRQDMRNGRIKNCEIYLSNDGKQWGQPVKKGRFNATGEEQVVEFAKPLEGRFLKFVAVSSFEKMAYASLAEIEVIPAK
jgi:beta-galactosidase